MTSTPLCDAMGARPLVARWVIQGRLTVVTALHLGGNEGEHVDMPVLRDSTSGQPLLPGTTLAGALRSALSDRLAGFGANEPAAVARLFGSRRGDDSGAQSPLIFFDAVGKLAETTSIEMRDGVAIAPSTGVAEDRKKYDYEVLPAGTTFPVRVDLLVPDGASTDYETQLLVALAVALDSFSHGANALGVRRTRGLGKVRAEWSARRYALASRHGWIQWALSEHQPALPSNLKPIRQAIAEASSQLSLSQKLPDLRSLVTIKLHLQVQHDVLVRSASTVPDAPDVFHLHSGGAPILPGTSLAGVMRAQALRIAKLVRRQNNDAERWINRLFGPRFEGQRAAPGFDVHASRVRVEEARLEQSRPQTQTRIAVDRFTQGVVEGALFDERPEVGGSVNVTLELRDPKPGELGLVLLVVKDLLEGRVAVGGSSSIGRGVFRGTASLCIPADNDKAALTASLEPGKPPAGTAADAVQQAISELLSAPSLGADSTAALSFPAGGQQ